PTAVNVTPGDSSLDVSWTPAVDSGGATITSFTATATQHSNGATAGSSTGASSPTTITGLKPGVRYDVTVTATNDAGTGPASAPVTAIAGGAPLAPKNVIATPGNSQASLSWTAPPDAANTIDDY